MGWAKHHERHCRALEGVHCQAQPAALSHGALSQRLCLSFRCSASVAVQLLHCTTVHSTSSLPTLTLDADHRNSFPLLTGTPPLSDPRYSPLGAPGSACTRSQGTWDIPCQTSPLSENPRLTRPGGRQSPPALGRARRPDQPAAAPTVLYPPGPHGNPPWANNDPPRASDIVLAAAPTAGADNTLGPPTTGGAPERSSRQRTRRG